MKKFKALGWEGPVTAKGHSFMVLGKRKVKIPNEHGEDLSIGLIGRILSQAGIDTESWNNA